MERKTLEKLLIAETAIIWDSLCEMYPKLCKFNPPVIRLCGRLWRTAGMCHQEDRIVQIGYKFFLHSAEYRKQMFSQILPHEIIHQADFDLFGESEKICGHGENWQKIMLEYGLKPDFYHTMEISRK
jgi:predicted SprT family Zn-dependent metalloprotease